MSSEKSVGGKKKSKARRRTKRRGAVEKSAGPAPEGGAGLSLLDGFSENFDGPQISTEDVYKPPSRLWRLCGFTPKLSKQNAFGAMGLQFTSFMAQFQADLIMFFRYPLNLIYLVINWIGWVLGQVFNPGPFGIPYILYYALVFFGFYALQIFWPLWIRVIVDFITPLLNVLIVVFNALFQILIIILRIVFQIWNIFVPFIGMILYVVIDVVVTIFRAVLDVLGQIDIMPIVQAILEILFFLIDIVLQIIMVLVEVGMSVLQSLTEIIGYLIELLMSVVKIILDIAIWIIDFAFRILEPILFIIQALAAAFSWMTAAKKMVTGRKLLSVATAATLVSSTLFGNPQQNIAQDQFDEVDLPKYDDYIQYIYRQYRDQVNNGNSTSRILTDQYHLDLEVPSASEENIAKNIEIRKNAGMDPDFHNNAMNSGRQLFQYQAQETFSRKPGVEFQDDPHDHLDQTSATFMHHFHSGAKKIASNKGDLNLMHESMERIMNHWKSPDRLSAMSIIRRFNTEHPHFSRTSERGPGSIRYNNVPEHPRDMHVRFHEDRKAYATRNNVHHKYTVNAAKHLSKFKRPGGRSLLQHPHGASQWDDTERVHVETLAQMEREHAKEIVRQEKQYYNHHTQRIKTARVIHSAARGIITKHAETTLHPNTIQRHFSTILKQFGYKSAWDVYHEFIDTHGDAATFVASLSSFTENPFLKMLKERDPAKDSRPFFHDWMQQQKQLKEMREVRHPTTGRKLFQDEGVGNEGESQEKFDGLEIITKTDCFSAPRNPLCLPEIPPDFEFEISTITWPDDIKEDADICPPWKNTKCLWCWERFFNAFQSLRFIISGMFPPLNFALTVFTELLPFLSWSVNWVFLVDKGELASVKQVLCFIIHIYDLFVFFLTLWFFGFFILPLLKVLIISPWQNCVQSYYQNRQLEVEWASEVEDDPDLDDILFSIQDQARRDARTDAFAQTISSSIGKQYNTHIFNLYNTPPSQYECADTRFTRLVNEHAQRISTHNNPYQKLMTLLLFLSRNIDDQQDVDKNEVDWAIRNLENNHPLLKDSSNKSREV